MEEEFPFSYTAEVPVEMEQEDVEKVMATLAMVETVPMDDEMPKEMAEMETSATPQPGAQSEPMKLRVGEFMDQDAIHKGSGTAAIYRTGDGSLLLRLENLDVTNGPDLRVLLSTHPDPDRKSDLEERGYVHLGKLKGNKGSQNYPIEDPNVDPDTVGSVVIYCMPFHVVFSVATLEDPA